jgi:hypothetical protein
MGESNLDKFERADLFDNDSKEIIEEFPSRWEILTRNADLPWIREISNVGKSINIASHSLKAI